MNEAIKVVVTYRVCQHWRAPIFAKIGSQQEIELCVLHGQDVPGTKLVNGKVLSGFRHHGHWTVKRYGSPWVVSPFLFLSLIREKPDVILAEGGSNFLNNFAIFLYAKLWKSPVIWWTLGKLVEKKYQGIAGLYRRIALWQERLSSVFLGYSSVALQHFSDMGYEPESCFRAVNVVDTSRILENVAQDANEAIQLRKKLGLAQKQVVLFVGALTASKSIDRLIRVFAKLQKELPNLHLLIVGEGADRQRLEVLAGQKIDASCYTFTGKVIQNIGAYYELAEVFVLPGLGGLAISESLAHGVPVICGRGDGCEVDLVINGVTGYRTSSQEDVEVEEFLESKLRLVLGDLEFNAELRRNAFAMIREKHNVDSYIENVVDAIRFAHTGSRNTRPPLASPRQKPID